MQTDADRAIPLLMGKWSIPLILGAVALTVMVLGDGTAEMLRYQREAILQGAFWRLFSGHLVHLGWWHLLLNLAGLWLIWAVAGDSLTVAGWWLLFFFCALFTALGLLLFNPELLWYVGLSGILHGLLLAGLLAPLLAGRRDVLVLLVALIMKLGWEQLYGPMPGSEATVGGAVVVDAHLYGAIAGGVGTALMFGVPRWRRRFLP